MEIPCYVLWVYNSPGREFKMGTVNVRPEILVGLINKTCNQTCELQNGLSHVVLQEHLVFS